tara:strand:+ start:2764 stop:2910 length:147 start_codon:yes stop_codon:yes gene_type:complete
MMDNQFFKISILNQNYFSNCGNYRIPPILPPSTFIADPFVAEERELAI